MAWTALGWVGGKPMAWTALDWVGGKPWVWLAIVQIFNEWESPPANKYYKGIVGSFLVKRGENT
jgi:hypothetical protein